MNLKTLLFVTFSTFVKILHPTSLSLETEDKCVERSLEEETQNNS